jgi:hypothetical protein
MSVSLDEAARRVVADLMPIAIVVADLGSVGGGAALVGALERAGAGAELFSPGVVGFDLAMLLAGAAPPRDGAAPALIEGLAAVSDRLLFVPDAEAGPDLDAWFELFAEQGYQPVVDYDAGFLGQGAFLVDRNATAAETELSAFAERLSMGGALAASTQRVAVLEAALGSAGDQAAMRAELAAARTALEEAGAREAVWRGRAEAAEAELSSLRADVAAWQAMAGALGAWIRAVCARSDRDGLAGLRAVAGATGRGSWVGRLWRRGGASGAERRLLADAALIRGSTLFDPGWYIACHPDLARSGDDPVWHYVVRGAAEGADPGPYFDAAAYRAAHPEVEGNVLAHRIRSEG